MNSDNLGFARVERQLVEQMLQRAILSSREGSCHASRRGCISARPDVAGKLFEPPLRAWASPTNGTNVQTPRVRTRRARCR